MQCPWCKQTKHHLFVYILSWYDLFWWHVPEKIAFWLGLQHSGTKYLYFIWANRSTALLTVMVHSARSIMFLFASFDVALPSEREKPSWIDWTIEVSSSTRWVLLSWFPARRSRFRVSRHTTYCARRSLTSYPPVVHMCSHFSARVDCRYMLSETALALQQVPQHFDGVRAYWSLFAQQVAFISFTFIWHWLILENGISTIGKWMFTILQNGMFSLTNKYWILSPQCLAYWSKGLVVLQ